MTEMTKISGMSVARRLSRHVRLMVFLSLLSLIPVLISCYGRFPLTRAVYDFNGDIGSGPHEDLVESVVFWGFLILPVYGIATLGDAVIFNLVEFWTGDSLEISYEVERPDGARLALTPQEDGREALLTLSRDGQVLEEHRFVRISPEEIEMRNAQGRLDGRILRSESGELRLTDAHGSVIKTISAQTLQRAGVM